MTTLGKILAIFTLVGSVAVAALCVFLYTGRLRLIDSNKQYQQAYALLLADNKAYLDSNKKLIDEKEGLSREMAGIADVKPTDTPQQQAEKLKTAFATLKREKDSEEKGRKNAEEKLLDERKKTSEFDATVSAGQTVVKQYKKDLDKLKELFNNASEANTKLQDAANKAREEKVKAEIERDAAQETARQLQERTDDLVKEIVRLRRDLQTGGQGPGPAVAVNQRNPPNFALDGKVKEVSGEQVLLSVGSDAGLVKGHTMDVFRTSPKPQWLGTVRLIRVEPTEAVGQFIGKPVVPVQRGDTVASKILGN